MAGYCSAFAGGLAQHFFDCIQAFFSDDCLPGVIADAVGEGQWHVLKNEID